MNYKLNQYLLVSIQSINNLMMEYAYLNQYFYCPDPIIPSFYITQQGIQNKHNFGAASSYQVATFWCWIALNDPRE